MNGFLLIDKDQGLTSFDVIRQIKRISGEKKVGHAGTLDPLATGLLLVALGEGTKLLEFLIGCDKKYEVLAKFGFVSDTFDADGVVELGDTDKSFSSADLKRVIEGKFMGRIRQVPPKFSAVKVLGKRLCDLVRRGVDVEEQLKDKVRDVEIYDFKVEDFNWPLVRFTVSCGSGTYIRSLVHDLGRELGVGGYVCELRRLAVADFDIAQAIKVEVLNNKIEQYLISIEDFVSVFSSIELSDVEFMGVKDGAKILYNKIEQKEPVIAFYKGKVVGVIDQFDDGMIKFKKRIFS